MGSFAQLAVYGEHCGVQTTAAKGLKTSNDLCGMPLLLRVSLKQEAGFLWDTYQNVCSLISCSLLEKNQPAQKRFMPLSRALRCLMF